MIWEFIGTFPPLSMGPALTLAIVKYFLLSAPVDWQPDQLIRRFLLPTGDYISCVLWLVCKARGDL